MSKRAIIGGGQQRTINAPCGWTRKGHPTQVNKIFQIHARHCKVCKTWDLKIPEFNSTAALHNGWDGLNDKDRKPDTIIHSVVITDDEMKRINEEAALAPVLDPIINILEK